MEATGFPDATSEQIYRRRTASLLDNFWDGELASSGTALHEELGFELRLDPGDGSPVVRIGGSIDRIDRLPSGGSISPQPKEALPLNDSTGVAFDVVDERLCCEQAQDDDGRHAGIDREDHVGTVPPARDRSDL